MTEKENNTTTNTNQLAIFNYGESIVRSQVSDDGDIWWVAKDVCDILGYSDHNSAVRNHLDEDEKGMLVEHTPGGDQKLLSVNESGLYTLMVKSVKPKARPFRKWVTSEVLPMIRKTGKYDISNNTTPITHKIAANLEATLKVAKMLGLKGNQAVLSANKSIERSMGINCMLSLDVTHIVSEDQVQYLTPTLIGKPLGLSAVKVNKKIEAAGFQVATRDHKERIVWVVTESGMDYCQLLDTNKRHHDGTPIMQIKWAKSVGGLI